MPRHSLSLCWVGLLVILLIGAASTTSFTSTAVGAPPAQAGWTKVWGDEFDGPAIDTTKWGYELGYIRNNELQYYTDRSENARIENGMLLIEGRKETYNGYNYTSGSLTTQGKHQFQYGRIEMRAKLPYSQGTWPAFWTLGVKGSPVDTACWPATGEIDIMEMVGGGVRDSQIHGTAHWNSGNQTWCGADHDGSGQMYQLPSGKFADDYHIFAIEWSATEIKWFMDNVNYHTVNISAANQSELRQPHYLLLNLAIGGGWPGSPDATSVFPMKYYIDYVRVYTNCANCPTATPTSAPAPVSVPLRIEAGGSGNFTDTSGNVWNASADTAYALGGGTVDRGAIAIANTDNDKVYQTERWGVARYDIPVSQGNYTVKLHFAETWLDAAGQRVFDVNVEGQALNGLDVFAQAGGKNTALVKTFNNVAVSDGVLTIAFTRGVEAPIINGVEVLAGTAGPTSTSVPTTSTPAAPTSTPTSGGSGGAHAGTWVAKKTSTSTSWAFISQYVNVSQNTSYSGSVWVRGTGTVELSVLSGQWGSPLKSVSCAATSGWTQCSTGSFNTGANSTVTFALRDVGAAGTYYLDDAFFGTGGNLLANPGFESGDSGWSKDSVYSIVQLTGSPTNTPAPTNTSPSQPTQTTAPTATTAPPAGTNKLANPGLESGNTGWGGVAGSWSILQPGAGNTNTGTWAFKATTTQQYGSGTGPSQTIANVPANTNYVARFWLKGTGSVKMVVNNSSWGYIGAAQCTATGTWTQCSFAFNTGSNTGLIIQMQDHAAGTAYVDDLYVGTP